MHFRLPQNILDAFVFSVICLWSVILMPDVNRACVKKNFSSNYFNFKMLFYFKMLHFVTFHCAISSYFWMQKPINKSLDPGHINPKPAQLFRNSI